MSNDHVHPAFKPVLDSVSKPRQMGVDEKCWELARLFMSDVTGHTEQHVRELAEAIQQDCEDHCKGAEEDAEEARRAS